MSAHIPEANKNGIKELNIIIDEASALGLKVILDVSKPMMANFKIPKNIYSLRLDWGFSLDDVISMSQEDYLIDLNASIIKEEDLLYLKTKEVNFNKLRASHNFFPKPYTGLTHEDVLEINIMYKKYGIPVLAFIPSNINKRPPIYEGLPSIEEHRHLSLYAITSELSLLEIDEICFGDAFCSIEELKIATDFITDELIIPISINKGISPIEIDILKRKQIQRKDANAYFVRSSIRENNEIMPFNTVIRRKKDITIDNVNFARYQGEVGIMKQDLEQDLRVNVVGHALISDFLLMRIKPNQKFNFIIVGDENGKSNYLGGFRGQQN